MNGNVIRTITIRGTSEGLDKVTADLNKLASAQTNVAVVSEQSAKRVLSLEDAWKRQTLKLDEAARAQANIARETKLADAALREGVATQAQHAQRLDQINQRYGAVSTATQTLGQHTANLTKQTSRSTAEMLNLSRQVADVGVSLQAGQSLLTVGIQQGAQIMDVFASSGRSVGQIFGQAATWAGRFVTSTAGVVTGIGAIALSAVGLASSWASAQREIDVAMLGVGRRSGVTAKDINEIARTSATTFGLSVDQARGAALEFVKTGAIYRDNIKTAVDVTHDFSIVTGKNATDAAKDLAAALANPVAGADALNKQIGFLDGRTREYISTLVSQNRNQEAQAVLLKALAPAIQGATNTLGPFEKAWDAVANAAIRAKNAMGAALTPQTNEERRDALQAIINRQSTPLLEGTPVDTRSLDKSKVAAMRLEVEALNEAMRESARAYALSGGAAKQWSIDANDAVKALIPEIAQLEQLKKLRSDLARTSDPNVSGRQGQMAEQNKAADDALQVRTANTQTQMEMAARRNAYMVELLRLEQESVKVGGARAGQEASRNLELLKQLDILKDQLNIAQASSKADLTSKNEMRQATINQIRTQGLDLVGATRIADAEAAGEARKQAQYQVDINEARRQGFSLAEATRLADEKQAVRVAQIAEAHRAVMVALQGQLTVAQQVNGLAQINAQYEANIVSLLEQNFTLVQAIAQAEMQRKIAIAQVNAEADRQLKTLQQEGELIRASSDADRDRIKARQTYQNLFDKGVDSTKAAAVASQQLRNAEEERSKAEIAAADNALKHIKTASDAWAAYKDNIISWSVANDEAGNATRRMAKATEDASYWADKLASSMFSAGQAALIANSKFVPFATTWASMGPTSLGTGAGPQGPQGLTQFDPAGYTSTINRTGGMDAATPGAGQFITNYMGGPPTTSETFTKLTNQHIDAITNAGLTSGRGYSQIIDQLLAPVSELASFNPGSVQATAQLLGRMTALLPEQEQIEPIQKQIDLLQQQPHTLARDELIKQLTDQLKQLTDASKENTDALKTQADPLFSQGHEYLNQLRIGYYKAAEGGIFGPGGPMSLMPINRYAGGGVASSPQMAMFGEAGPEAFIPLKGGAVPVTVKGSSASNDNSKNITQNITQNITINTTPADRLTGRQRAQGFITAATNAAAAA